MFSDIKAFCSAMDTQWKKFLHDQKIDLSIVNPTIYESWKRCKEYKIDPYMSDYNIFLNDTELEKTLQKNKELIEMAWPILETVIDNLDAGNFRVDLFDKDVYLLKTKGSQQIIEESKRLRSFPGVSKREEHSGTNAIALAYLTQKPILVVGAEHYIYLFHNWSCAAAPIKDSNDQILGFVNMTGPREEIHLHTLGMVLGIVKAIEHNLRFHEMAKELSVQNILLENVIETVEKGVAIFNNEGRINKISNSALQLLGISQVNIENLNLKNFIENWKLLDDLFSNKNKFFNQELFINIDNIRKSLYMEVKPLVIADGSTKALATFQELTRVQNLAKRYGTTGGRFYFKDIVGANKGLSNVVEMAKKASLTNAKVLLQGESGTGKELFAHAIHNDSIFSNGPFVTLNCSALPTELIESELFGYEEGAFTGAKKGGMLGKIELADGGTLFLDEINSMPLNLQSKLLRFLQTNSFMRLGGYKEMVVNVRIIAATNKDLKEEMLKGNFREDLFYRLNVVSIKIPPLRERMEDLDDLIECFLIKYSKEFGKTYVISRDFKNYLKKYNWPGNVRELENVMVRAMTMTSNGELTILNLPEEIIKPISLTQVEENYQPPLISLDKMEKIHIERVLQETNGNLALASRILGIGRSTLYRKISKYGLDG